MSEKKKAADANAEVVEPEAVQRVLVLTTDGNRAAISQNTMGLFEAKAILEASLAQINQAIVQAAQPQPAPSDDADEKAAE